MNVKTISICKAVSYTHLDVYKRQVSQAISVIVSLFVIVKRKTGISLKPSDFRPKRNVCGTILKIGIPIACQDGLIQIAFIIITIIANKRGLIDSAAVGIVEKMCIRDRHPAVLPPLQYRKGYYKENVD